ncbi:MAG: hypothetical protein EOP45_11530 [Sphingobacteriaceae bacterium]|nr:MAG: hypothetical protein EOP45_11530 [Sphingobacteriaceae bacterium]
MDINGWLTVISVFIAIVALLPREEQKLSILSIGKFEIILVFSILTFIIPSVIYFPELSERCEFFKRIEVSWGLHPKNVSFLLFFIVFIWIIIRLIWLRPRLKDPNNQVIEYYKELLNDRPFEEFFKLFKKYVSSELVQNQWQAFYSIIFHSRFLNNIFSYDPYYIFQFWNEFSDVQFKTVLRLLMENPNSPFYTEIKQHWNSYSLLPGKPLLSRILKINLKKSVRRGILPLVLDFSIRHLRSISDGIYNRPPYHSIIRGEEGFDLPVYYPIRFIGLLHSSAIERKIDVAGKGNMQSIYSQIVELIVDNLRPNNDEEVTEYSTNYHWLISEIFSLSSNWLQIFSIDYFVEHSSYVDFIPFSMSLSLNELYKGNLKGKISQSFLNSIHHYHILSKYFDFDLPEPMRESIENNIIKNIPGQKLRSILNFSLNESFAINYDELLSENFHMQNIEEQELLLRLKRVLIEA